MTTDDTTDAAVSRCQDTDTTVNTAPDTTIDADTGTETRTDTPVFDETVRALAATHSADQAASATIVDASSAVEHTHTDAHTDADAVTTQCAAPHVGVPEDIGDPQTDQRTQDAGDAVAEDWVDQWYGQPSPALPVLDPDSPEGAAILSLFRRIKDVNKGDGDWSGSEVINKLTSWLTDLGIDPDEDPMTAGRRLRLALRERPGGGLTSSVYGVRIGTDHDDPEAAIRTALHVLARQLGPGTGIELVSHDRELLDRIENRPDPNPAPTAGS